MNNLFSIDNNIFSTVNNVNFYCEPITSIKVHKTIKNIFTLWEG